MGLTYIRGTVTGPTSISREVDFLVDSGAIYSLLPHQVWKDIKLKSKKTLTFAMADGTKLKRKISECHFAVAGEDGHSPVILGEPDDDALIGAVTLETLGLVLDPFKRTLRAMQLRLG